MEGEGGTGGKLGFIGDEFGARTSGFIGDELDEGIVIKSDRKKEESIDQDPQENEERGSKIEEIRDRRERRRRGSKEKR